MRLFWIASGIDVRPDHLVVMYSSERSTAVSWRARPTLSSVRYPENTAMWCGDILHQANERTLRGVDVGKTSLDGLNHIVGDILMLDTVPQRTKVTAKMKVNAPGPST